METSLHTFRLQGGALPVLFLEVKGPYRALSATEGPYDHPGVTLEEAYLKSQYAGACAVKKIVAVKGAAGQPADIHLGKILALSIEIILQAVRVTCHWITSRNGKDQSILESKSAYARPHTPFTQSPENHQKRN